MPTRRQRRRREKNLRHEYGFVTVDEEGNEVEVDGSELRAKRPQPDKPKARAAASGGAKTAKPRRAARDPEAPTWRRSLRRGLLWSPATVVLSLIVFHTAAVPLRVAIGLAYAAMFVPLTYWMDGLVYRRFEKRRLAGPRTGKSR